MLNSAYTHARAFPYVGSLLQVTCRLSVKHCSWRQHLSCTCVPACVAVRARVCMCAQARVNAGDLSSAVLQAGGGQRAVARRLRRLVSEDPSQHAHAPAHASMAHRCESLAPS